MVHRPNPVQTIAQQRQSFQTPQAQQVMHPGYYPPVPPQPAEQPRPVDDLAEEIYVRLVSGQYLDTNHSTKLDQTHFRQLAEAAQTAAAAYFAIRANQEQANNG